MMVLEVSEKQVKEHMILRLQYLDLSLILVILILVYRLHMYLMI